MTTNWMLFIHHRNHEAPNPEKNLPKAVNQLTQVVFALNGGGGPRGRSTNGQLALEALDHGPQARKPDSFGTLSTAGTAAESTGGTLHKMTMLPRQSGSLHPGTRAQMQRLMPSGRNAARLKLIILAVVAPMKRIPTVKTRLPR